MRLNPLLSIPEFLHRRSATKAYRLEVPLDLKITVRGLDEERAINLGEIYPRKARLMVKRLFFSPILAGILVLLQIPEVFAQQRSQSPWVFKVDGGAAYQPEVDLKKNEGGFARDRWFFSAGADYGWSRRDSIGLSIGSGRSTYDFREDARSDGISPWNKIEESRVSVVGRFGLGENSSVIVIPSLRQTGENGASSSDSQTYGLLTAAFWKVRDTLTIGPGIGVFTRLEDGTRVFPILAIDWDISERWNLSTGRGLAATQGPGLTLSYQLNPAWSLSLAGRYEDFEFRLDDKGVASGGVGRDKSIPLVLSTRFESSANYTFSAFVGAEMGGSLSLRDQFGNALQEYDYDTALVLGVTFGIRF